MKISKAFTLLEITVALTILGVASSTAIAIMSESAHRLHKSEFGSRAAALAQSLIDRIGKDIAVRPNNEQGVFADGFRWSLNFVPFGDAADRNEWLMQPYEVSATVSWGEKSGHSVSLTVLHLYPKGM
ncbi:MAG: type II secretion system protein [Alphaproteobacteria bacterium]|nr:type II secretion system protein [Alphaproteobacteria bacterium]